MKKKLKTRDIGSVSSLIIDNKAFKASEHVDKVRKIADVMTRVTFGLKVDVIMYKDRSKVFIPTGTKDNPLGITNTDADVIAFCEFNSKTDFPHSFFDCVSVEELREFLGANWSKLKKGMSEDFKSMGVLVDFNFLDEITKA